MQYLRETRLTENH